MANEPAALPSIDGTPAAPPGSTPATPGTQQTVEQARARRDWIIKDSVTRGRYTSGDPAIVAEMRSLNLAISAETAASKLDAVLSGTAALGRHEVIEHGELPTTDLMGAVQGLRQNGLPDEVIRGIIEGEAVSPERHREAEIIKQQLLTDKAWIAAYRDGSRLHAEQLHRVLAVLTAPVIAESK
jgi:hypothetical protein